MVKYCTIVVIPLYVNTNTVLYIIKQNRTKKLEREIQHGCLIVFLLY